MKTRKNKLLNALKLGALFFGMILAFNNCQKEENYIVETPSPINLEKAKKMFAAQFNKETFPNLNHSPIWEEVKADYDNEGYFYYEIPFHLLNKKDINMSTSVSFDRLIVQEKEGAIKFKIIHFFNINIKSNPVNYQSLSHKNLLNFSGFITEYDMNKNVTALKYYKNGKDTYQKVKISNKKKDNLLSKANENSEEFSETNCTRWCQTFEGQDGEKEYRNCTDWVCHTSYYFLDDGSNSNSNGGNGDGNNTSYTSTNKECAEGYALNYDGKCVALPKIINELEGKADCSFKKLIASGLSNFHNMVTDLFVDFGDGNFGNKDLTFKMSTDLPIGKGGRTQSDGNGNYVILINSNLMNELSSIEIAAILVHEMSHAFLAKHYMDLNSSFTELYKKYINDSRIQNYSHDIMKDEFIGRMANALNNYDTNIFSSINDYKTLASQGVYELSPSQKLNLSNIKKKARQNDTSCK